VMGIQEGAHPNRLIGKPLERNRAG
jgi:hypothetical protein